MAIKIEYCRMSTKFGIQKDMDLGPQVLRDTVCDALRARIVSNQIHPGEPLREERLAAELHVSRTPLREAIRQLTEEGFVEQQPRRGARVMAMTPELVRETYEIREALEGMAARSAAQRIDESRVRFLRDYLERLRSKVTQGDVSDTGDVVHREIFAACGNVRLAKLMSVYRARVEWIQQAGFRVSKRLDHAFHEHDSIVRALECGDSQWAEAAARSHIRNTANELVLLFSDDCERGEDAA